MERGLSWPMHPSGNLCCDDETFKVMAKVYGHPFTLIREARSIISKMKDSKLSVGSDGRNRCMLSPFKSVTGRNQPSTSKFIFGQPSFKRSAIKAPPYMALAMVDWSQQEIGAGAGLSGDVAMKLAYSSGDPYLKFARQAGAVPANATKVSHPSFSDDGSIGWPIAWDWVYTEYYHGTYGSHDEEYKKCLLLLEKYAESPYEKKGSIFNDDK